MRIPATSFRLATALGAALTLGSVAFAQPPTASPTGFGRILFPGGGGPGSVPTSVAPSPTTGFGRILYPGTAAPAVIRPSGTSGTGVIQQPPTVSHPNHGAVSYVPYPVYSGGGYYNYGIPPALFPGDYRLPGQLFPNDSLHPGPYPTQLTQGANGQSASQAGLGDAGSDNDQPQAPVVIVNQYFRPEDAPAQTSQSVTRTAPQATAVPRPEPRLVDAAPDPIIYLIAMKDHSIYAASSYFLDGDTLNYTTLQGTQNSVSLDLIDRDLSRTLNRNRTVAFALPATK